MTILNIVTYPNDVLNNIADNVQTINKSIKSTLNNMVDTMIYANGIGLAAPQVGISLRMFVMHTQDDRIIKCINPVIIARSEEQHTMQEGCLSIPDVLINISRPRDITMEFMNASSKKITIDLHGIDASCAQHEIDHLNGILINDRSNNRS